MTVVKKNEGTYVPYRLTGTELSLQNGAMTLELNDLIRDWPVALDISEDGVGRLVLGESFRYAAQLELPARSYTIVKGAADDFGFPQLGKIAAPLDMDKVTLTLWALDKNSVKEV
jgi:hypothetical protein